METRGFGPTTGVQDVNYWTFWKARPQPKRKKALRTRNIGAPASRGLIENKMEKSGHSGMSGLAEGVTGAVEESSIRNGSSHRRTSLADTSGRNGR
jgi:hypothetical protein